MYAYDPKCLDQVARTMKILRGKWTVQILCALLDGPVRLSQLRRLIPTASKKALTANLSGTRSIGSSTKQRLRNLGSTGIYPDSSKLSAFEEARRSMTSRVRRGSDAA